MDKVLSVCGCSFTYGDEQFRLSGLSLAVGHGEMLGIVGPNGSGKSTLLRLMAGILRPHEGHVEVDGKELASFPRRELARLMAFLPQSSAPAFELTVGEVVALGRYPHLGAFGLLRETDKRAVTEALRETATDQLAHRHFSTLSGGEKQRVLVASVLAQEPRIMLLDEPSAALDIHHKAEVFDLLWSLSRKEIGVVVVTHDLDAASQYCDTLALLHGGRIVETGPPARVMREELLSMAYETPVKVVGHPLTSMPMVLVPGKRTREQDESRADSR